MLSQAINLQMHFNQHPWNLKMPHEKKKLSGISIDIIRQGQKRTQLITQLQTKDFQMNMPKKLARSLNGIS